MAMHYWCFGVGVCGCVSCCYRKEWDDCHKLVFLIPSLVTKVLLIRRLAVLIDWWSL